METWLTPYIEEWERELGGVPDNGQLMKFLGPLHSRFGPDVLPRWRAYLMTAGPLYANAARFSQTYGSWKPKRELKELPDPLNEEG